MIKTLRNFEIQTNTPHIVIFYVGTNDLNCSVFHRDVKNFDLLIRVAKEKYPQSKNFINAILPRHDFCLGNVRFTAFCEINVWVY